MRALRVIVVSMTLALGISFATAVGAAEIGDDDRAVVRSVAATLDGATFDAQYVGAVVQRNGLVTPCQQTLPSVRRGRFVVTVYARSVAKGCGAQGGEIFLWTFVHDRIVFSTQSVAWPGRGETVRFDPSFGIAAPDGGVGPLAGFAGEIFDRRGRRLPPGADVTAYIGTTRCAVATTRRIETFVGFSMDVVGPDAITGCELGEAIRFEVDGRVAVETAVNTPGEDPTVNLTLR
jgi:hypothetical protein